MSANQSIANLTEYRQSQRESERAEDLLRLISSYSNTQHSVIDIGARDGYFSTRLTQYFDSVTALDLEKPTIDEERIHCVQGDIRCFDFEDSSFDFVFCAEVLEHIPTSSLEQACAELARVSREFLLIGVPYRQDLRAGRTTCYSCGQKNPPWGHVNRFDEYRLMRLFPGYEVQETSFVGQTKARTSPIATWLMDLAGNPYGTYHQEEPCIGCGNKLKNPPPRKFYQKVFTKMAFLLNRVQICFSTAQPNWIHLLLRKKKG